jgi:glycosyltransferase involved in cell wall biosynthesis
MNATALPSISIVTCSYQQGKYLDATVRSVLGQHYPRLEYIVIDGGSTDASVEVIRRHAQSLAYWVSEPDRGQTDALVKGFARATGEIQGWLCSDDLLLPGALDAVGRFFQAHPQVQALYGDALWIDGRGEFIRAKKEIGFNRFIFLYDHNYVPQPSMFWRRALFDRVGGLDAGFDLAMDSDLWVRFSAQTRIVHLARYLSCMRFYPEQKTRALQWRARREDARLRERHPWLPQTGYPLLHLAARAARILRKAAVGGYRAKMLPEHVQWLQRHAIKEPR